MTKAIPKLKIEDLRQIINEEVGGVRNRYGNAVKRARGDVGECPNCGGLGLQVDKSGDGVEAHYQCKHCKGVWIADAKTGLPIQDWEDEWIDGPEDNMRLQRGVHEAVDHKSINSVVGVASKLLAAVEAFKEKAPPAAINAVTPQLGQLEKTLENMVSTPGSYVPVPKKEPKHVSLKPVKSESKAIKEATGEAGPELVDGASWGHLEVGNVYMCQVGDEHVKAEFKGWVDEKGQPTESEDPKQVRLMFADSSDGMEWEAYWFEDKFCAGSDADPLYVNEHQHDHPEGE